MRRQMTVETEKILSLVKDFEQTSADLFVYLCVSVSWLRSHHCYYLFVCGTESKSQFSSDLIDLIRVHCAHLFAEPNPCSKSNIRVKRTHVVFDDARAFESGEISCSAGIVLMQNYHRTPTKKTNKWNDDTRLDWLFVFYMNANKR